MRWGLLDDTQSPPADDEQADTPAALQQTADGLPPAVDLDAMKAQMGAVDEGSIEMLHMFVDMTAPLIERIQNAYNNEDFHDLHEAAHSLKGGSRSACCNVLGDIAAQLQDDAEQEKETCGTLVDQIVTEFDRVRTAVRELKAA